MKISLENIEGKKITVMGLGLNGGGFATAEFFAKHNAQVTVTDLKTKEFLASSILKLSKYKNIQFVLGEHRIEDFKNSDLVIKNPAVKLEGNKFLEVAKQIESDISIFLSISKAPILAVTGSKGKSSTVSALYYGLKKLGYDAFLGGNITVSPLSFIEKTSEKTPVVLELSSCQLADLKGRGLLKPKIAVLTPIMPDHLNWYGTMEKYVADKKIIYENMNQDDYLICNNDDEWGYIFADEAKSKICWYSENKLPQDKIGVFFDGSNGVTNITEINTTLFSNKVKIPGKKLRQNLLNAGLALILYGADPNKICNIMDEYKGLEHRLEFFHEKNGIKFYNDTTATIPEAVVSSLKSFSEPPILICGGTDKKLNFSPLAENAHLAKKIFLLQGSGTDLLIPLLKEKNIKIEGIFKNLEELLNALKDDLQNTANDSSGHLKTISVIFSPGATSFGLFKNEFDRGNKFKELVKNIFG